MVSTEDAIKDAEIIVSLVDHDEFKAIKNSIEDSKSVIDIKGLWNDENKKIWLISRMDQHLYWQNILYKETF